MGNVQTFVPDTGSPATIGRIDAVLDHASFQVSIDEVLLHDRELTPAEIADLMDLCTESVPAVGPVGLGAIAILMAAAGVLSLRRRAM